MPLFVADRILTGDGGVSASPAWALVEGGYIVAVGSGDAPAQADRHDLSGLLLAPAFCDLQINGVGPVDFATATRDEIVDAVDGVVEQGAPHLGPAVESLLVDLVEGAAGDAEAIFLGHTDRICGVRRDGPRGTYSGSAGSLPG